MLQDTAYRAIRLMWEVLLQPCINASAAAATSGRIAPAVHAQGGEPLWALRGRTFCAEGLWCRSRAPPRPSPSRPPPCAPSRRRANCNRKTSHAAVDSAANTSHLWLAGKTYPLGDSLAGPARSTRRRCAQGTPRLVALLWIAILRSFSTAWPAICKQNTGHAAANTCLLLAGMGYMPAGRLPRPASGELSPNANCDRFQHSSHG